MGNVLILRHVSVHQDLTITGASQFLTQSVARAVPEFRTFRAALDLYGFREPARGSAVIAGAEAAFRACVTWLDAKAAAGD